MTWRTAGLVSEACMGLVDVNLSADVDNAMCGWDCVPYGMVNDLNYQRDQGAGLNLSLRKWASGIVAAPEFKFSP